MAKVKNPRNIRYDFRMNKDEEKQIIEMSLAMDLPFCDVIRDAIKFYYIEFKKEEMEAKIDAEKGPTEDEKSEK